MKIQKLDIVSIWRKAAPPTCGAAFPKDEDYKTLLVRKDERKNKMQVYHKLEALFKILMMKRSSVKWTTSWV